MTFEMSQSMKNGQNFYVVINFEVKLVLVSFTQTFIKSV